MQSKTVTIVLKLNTIIGLFKDMVLMKIGMHTAISVLLIKR